MLKIKKLKNGKYEAKMNARFGSNKGKIFTRSYDSKQKLKIDVLKGVLNETRNELNKQLGIKKRRIKF